MYMYVCKKASLYPIQEFELCNALLIQVFIMLLFIRDASHNNLKFLIYNCNQIYGCLISGPSN